MMALRSDEVSNAVDILLQRPNLETVESLRDAIKADPFYLVYHHVATANTIRRILWADGRGIYIEVDSEAILILGEAIRRIVNSSAA
jgi:hypothetical protein